jgi:hypothetical protein
LQPSQCWANICVKTFQPCEGMAGIRLHHVGGIGVFMVAIFSHVLPGKSTPSPSSLEHAHPLTSLLRHGDVRAAEGRGLPAGARAVEALGPHEVCHERVGAYVRHLDATQHHVGQEHTQTLASKQSNLRTRIKRFVRRTIACSKMECMHDLVIGLFINRDEFERPL